LTEPEYKFGKINDLPPLTKLLYAVLWKNGDLAKVKHVVKGILDKRDESDNSIIFYQFGRHLSEKKSEPIVDQHVLRAFGILSLWKTKDS
jgi:hypothetical protein